ncbi:Bacilysin biosynthesis oxidoreductase YwfH (plasmid) [Burkholderia sp. AD24]|nr:Bacilysin biosynthesis oxidoreductase YwfH [Burkholderia sp. AD24]
MTTTDTAAQRTALILGGSKGLGLGVAQTLSAQGVAVGLVGRDVNVLNTAAVQLREAGGNVRIFPTDLRNDESVEALLHEVELQLGRVDILLLNGGGPPPFLASHYNPQVWSEQFGSMVLSQIKVATHFLPGMRMRGFGRILIVSSTSVREPIPGLTVSNSLRPALAGWAKSLAGEVASEGVTVNVVMPGRFATERTNYLDALDAKERGVEQSVTAAESQAEIPMKRYGRPEEFGAIVAFLASDQGAYITGVALPIDGGLSRAIV